ncbi:MAG: LacI family DNA-binding transcriptional regulator [Anaerolineaceae bacterium]|nr:LacI family DNA-binding transcriptional regulator [Anaerolineaceae bacterium]
MKKRATSFDVAQLAGVSRTTVSFVLNNVPGVNLSDATRQRVLDAAKQLKYHPNASGRKLVSGRSYTIGLVLQQSSDQIFADALLIRVLIGVEQAAEQQGYHVLLKPLNKRSSTGYTNLVQENNVDGIILSGPREDDTDIIQLHTDGYPVILMGQMPGTDIPFVDINAQAGAVTAVEHLIELGHSRIAMITNASLEYVSAQQRRAGYKEALEKHNLPYDEALVREGDYTPDSGHIAMADILKINPRPTAVFVASDVVAMGALQAIRVNDLHIPQDMAVVGFDDIPLAGYYTPALTTIHLPAFGLGWAVGERLVNIIQGETLDQNGIFLESRLVVRESSK